MDGMIKMENEYYEKLEKGREWEDKAILNLRKQGAFADRYEIEIRGRKQQLIQTRLRDWIRCPDIEVYSSKNCDDILFRMEVKSYQKLFEDWYGRIGKTTPSKKYLTMKVFQFDDYYSLMTEEEIDIKIVFRVISDKKWYWNTLWELSQNLNIVGDAYNKGDKHYLWDVEMMRTDFSKIHLLD